MDTQGNTVTPGTPDPELNRIPSVNSRGGVSQDLVTRCVFVVALVAVLAIGGLVTYRQLNAAATTKKTQAELAAKSENKPAAVSGRRRFDTTEGIASDAAQGRSAALRVQGQACADGSPGMAATLPNGQAVLDGNHRPMIACNNGAMIVPALDTAANAPPVPTSGAIRPASPASAVPAGSSNHIDRYGGDVILSGGGSARANYPSDAGDPMNNPLIRMAMSQGLGGQGGQPAQTSGPAGSVGNLLQSSVTQTVQAGKLGDRNMVLPMGRSIECGLSIRMVSDLAGLTSCVLSQDVYSDNGRVVLLERGSEATGEYRAVSELGQRRLFVIWTRIRTPNGVIINLDSPGSDSLGTSGLPGKVDNHWWQRVGGAFLLSTVKDAIAYKTAEASSGSAGEGILYQNSATAGDRMAEKVLDSTINIRPTIFKAQGDRGSIYVARDLDFGSVYALRAQ